MSLFRYLKSLGLEVADLFSILPWQLRAEIGIVLLIVAMFEAKAFVPEW